MGQDIKELKLESKQAINALYWITDILNKHNVTCQISGGLAVKVYGSTRPLSDIDIDITYLSHQCRRFL